MFQCQSSEQFKRKFKGKTFITCGSLISYAAVFIHLEEQ